MNINLDKMDQNVRKIWNKDNSLHPIAITKLMMISAIR